MNRDEIVDDISYDSWKEDRDVILEYNQVSLEDESISNLLGLGVNNITAAQSIAKVIKMIKDGGVHHVISLNPYKTIRLRSNKDLNLIYSKTSMRIASGGGMLWISRMLKQTLKERIPMLGFLMELIRVSEKKEYTIFIVGGKPETAEKAFFNIRKSFPKIRIVGRHGGFFDSQRERSVIEAIRKSEANIVLVGMGFPKEDRWIHKIRTQFKKTVFIGVGGSLDIIAGENRKAPEYFMTRGLEWFYRIITKPWRFFRLLRIFFFYFRILLHRMFIKR